MVLRQRPALLSLAIPCSKDPVRNPGKVKLIVVVISSVGLVCFSLVMLQHGSDGVIINVFQMSYDCLTTDNVVSFPSSTLSGE